MEDFVDDLSRWYVRRSRDRISSGDNEALSTLYEVLLNLSKASAPIIPFVSENIFRLLSEDNKDNTYESVHLCEFPSFDESYILKSKDIMDNMKKTREIVSAALSIRVEKGIPVRQVLNSIAVKKEHEIPDDYKSLVIDEVNIKNIEFVSSLDEKVSWEKDISETVCLDIVLTTELIKEGKYREFVRNIQDLRKSAGLSVSDEIILTFKNDAETKDIIDNFKDDLKRKLLVKEMCPGEENKIEKA